MICTTPTGNVIKLSKIIMIISCFGPSIATVLQPVVKMAQKFWL
jgi:hypothetical protein